MTTTSAFSRHGSAVVGLLLLVTGCYMLLVEPSATLTLVPDDAPRSAPKGAANSLTDSSVEALHEGRTPAEVTPDASANSPAAPSHPGDEATCSVIVRVVRGGQPVGGAEVVWADAAAVERHRVALAAGAVRAPEALALADRLRAIGAVARTGDDGEVELAVRGAPLVVHAVHEGLTATNQFTEVASGQRFELQLEGGDVLRMHLVDAAGLPVPQMPVVAVWQRADPKTGLGQQVLQLGVSDADGHLVFLSWSATARAAHAALGVPGASTLVGPAMVGLLEQGFVWVSERAPDHELVLVVSESRVIDCQLTTAAGDPFFLDGLQTMLWSAAGVLAETSADASGRTRHLVARDAELAWRAHFVDVDYGSGLLPRAQSNSTERELRCDAVCSVRGAVLGDARGCEVRYHTQRRGEVRRSLELQEGRFWLPLPMPENVPSLSFSIDAQRISVEVPSAVPPTWDLGVLRGSNASFARLRLTANGEPFVGEVGWRTSGEGLAVGFATVEVEGRDFVVQAPAGVQSVRVQGVVSGFAAFSVDVVRGGVADVVLQPLVTATVGVIVASGLDTERLRVGLRQRWNESARAWQPLGVWHPVRRVGEDVSATFADQPAGRYVVEVWSMVPPRALVAAEVLLGGAEAVELDASGARDVRFYVDAGADGFWLAVGSALDADVPICVCHMPSGDGLLTVAAEEREVLLMSPGRTPMRAPVSGAALRALLSPLDMVSLGLGDGVSRRDPIVVGKSPRPVHVFSITADGVSFEVVGLPQWARSVLLPCDYGVEINGQSMLARWGGGSWRIEAR